MSSSKDRAIGEHFYLRSVPSPFRESKTTAADPGSPEDRVLRSPLPYRDIINRVTTFGLPPSPPSENSDNF
jgi:hypothetical protein